jgi:flagellar hook-length control protein FliK
LEPIQKTLDLSNLITPDLQLTLDSMSAGDMSSGQESPAHGQGHFSGRTDQTTALVRSESSANGSATPDMDPAQRRESIQNLAEKMGQAVGQRILSEIERGQWHLKLSLRPATLGHIEVEMRMRSGEMDAVFTAGQALTRELLNEGMSKLKDTLNQMGMDVASLKVDDGHNRQRGGDSTPDRQANVRDNAPTESADAPASQPVLVQTKMGSEGWDVLV